MTPCAKLKDRLCIFLFFFHSLNYINLCISQYHHFPVMSDYKKHLQFCSKWLSYLRKKPHAPWVQLSNQYQLQEWWINTRSGRLQLQLQWISIRSSIFQLQPQLQWIDIRSSRFQLQFEYIYWCKWEHLYAPNKFYLSATLDVYYVMLMFSYPYYIGLMSVENLLFLCVIIALSFHISCWSWFVNLLLKLVDDYSRNYYR